MLVGNPGADEYSGALDERLLHVGPLFGSDDSHEQFVELGALDVLDHRLVEVRERGLAELREGSGL